MNRFPILMLLIIALLVACRPAGREPAAVSAQNLIGYRVVDREARVIGVLEEIVIETGDQQISYGVVGIPRAPYSYKGAKVHSMELYVPIPWAQLTLDAARKELVLSGPAGALRDAPALINLNEIATPGWDTTVRAYWEKGTQTPAQEP